MAYTFPAGNAIWTDVDVIALLCTKMSSADNRPATVLATVIGESGCNPLALGKVIWNPGKPTHLSFDIGLFQLNSYYHTVTGPYPDVPPITFAAALDPMLAFEQAWKVMNKNRPDAYHYNLQPWTVYNTGAYDKYLQRALTALAAYRALPA